MDLKDVLTLNGKDFKIIKLKEGKTHKDRAIKLNRTAQKALREIFDSLDKQDINDNVFSSREKEKLKPLLGNKLSIY